MKNILLCGAKYTNNFGDPIINDCTKKILEDQLRKLQVEYSIDEVDLEGRCNYNEFYSINKSIKGFLFFFCSLTIKLIRKTSKIAKFYRGINFANNKIWWFSKQRQIFDKYYKEKIKKADFIIFVGGGMIKYKYQNCHQNIDYITKYADKYNKKVFFNAVGVEDFDIKNYNCKKLKTALNRKCVKMITTRDDIDTLKKYISNRDINIGKVADPAVYVSDVYSINKDNNSNCIGLCVCRENLFRTNGINYSTDEMLELWKTIIKNLENKNYEWRIYTNGLDADNDFATKLLKYLGKEKNEKICIIPKTPKELVAIVSKFKAIIATRLHSCIISYSLGIPAIGLVWNVKLKLFGNNINYPDRFFEKDNFVAEKIVHKMEEAIEEKYNETKNEFKESIIKSINEIAKRISENV